MQEKLGQASLQRDRPCPEIGRLGWNTGAKRTGNGGMWWLLIVIVDHSSITFSTSKIRDDVLASHLRNKKIDSTKQGSQTEDASVSLWFMCGKKTPTECKWEVHDFSWGYIMHSTDFFDHIATSKKIRTHWVQWNPTERWWLKWLLYFCCSLIPKLGRFFSAGSHCLGVSVQARRWRVCRLADPSVERTAEFLHIFSNWSLNIYINTGLYIYTSIYIYFYTCMCVHTYTCIYIYPPFHATLQAVKVIDLHRFCLHPAYDKLRHHIMREMSLLLMLSHRRGVAAQGQCRLCRFPVVDSSYSCCGGD